MIEDYNCKVIDIEARFGNEEEHDSLCVAMFRSVLTPYVYKYDDDIMLYRFTRHLVVQTLDKVPGLRTLHLLSEGADDDDAAQITRKIYQLRHLQAFTFQRYCTDEVIEQLALHCSRLIKVDLFRSRGVTNASVQHLLRLRKLQFINVDGTRIDNKHYGLLLSELPIIKNINFGLSHEYILPHVAEERLQKIPHVSGFVPNINMLAQRCHNITNLDIETVIGDMSALAALTTLRTVRISHHDYVISNLIAVLTGVGSKLTELTLSLVTRVNLQDIVTLCPSLEVLGLLVCSYFPLDSDVPLGPRLPHFRNLISLTLYMSRRDQMNYKYIRYYVSLKKIRLLSINITVGFMKGVLNSGAFANLEEFEIFEHIPGTMCMEAVELLIQSCSRLKIIRGLETCNQIPSSFIQELKRRFLVQNLDVEITLRQRVNISPPL
jgi:hypothetical protein